MNCPKCNSIMKPGYLQSESPMLWSAKKRKIFFLPDLDDDDVWMDNIDGMGAFGISGVHKEAFHCPKCGMIIIPNQD